MTEVYQTEITNKIIATSKKTVGPLLRDLINQYDGVYGFEESIVSEGPVMMGIEKY